MRKRILVVDDERAVGDMLQSMLTAAGYDVSQERSSTVAAELLKQPEQYDLLVTDVQMPKVTGLDLVRQLRQAGSTMPVLLISGYSVLPWESMPSGVRFLSKPFDLAEFRRQVKQLLGE
jgi:DNA-binding response OmpR family regulator